MTDKEEALFERLATEAIEAAERADVPGRVFVEGLKLMAAQIAERAAMSEDEFRE